MVLYKHAMYKLEEKNRKTYTIDDFQLNTGPLNAENLKFAKIELRETPENVETGLRELRELLKNDSTLTYSLDDFTLTVFLRPCKWYAQSAYKLMKSRAHYVDKLKPILSNLSLEDERVAFTEESSINILKDRDQLRRRILVLNMGELWNPSKINTDQILRIFFSLQQMAILEPETQVRGFIVIFDFNGLGMKQVRAACSPTFASNLLEMAEDNLILRLKEIHIVRQPYIFKLIWQLFKPLMSEKLKNRVHMHGYKMASLHKYLDPACLPADYEGKLPKVDYNGKQWWPIVEKYTDHFQKWSSFVLNKNGTDNNVKK